MELYLFIRPIIAAGDTYPHDPNSSKQTMYTYFIDDGVDSFVAESNEGTLVGVYCIRKNQRDLGSHVANIGCMVDPKKQNQGIATALGKQGKERKVRSLFL